tara:strand:- start:191 stop:433 length:243 start_codon:yes stop_codon:yes gene_type:complete
MSDPDLAQFRSALEASETLLDAAQEIHDALVDIVDTMDDDDSDSRTVAESLADFNVEEASQVAEGATLDVRAALLPEGCE